MRVHIKHRVPINILLLLAASAVGIGAVRMTRSTMALRAEVREADARLGAIAAQKHEIVRRLDEQDAPEAVEYRAKATMNLKNPGEEVVVVVPEEKGADPAEMPGFWQKIRNFLSRIF